MRAGRRLSLCYWVTCKSRECLFFLEYIRGFERWRPEGFREWMDSSVLDCCVPVRPSLICIIIQLYLRPPGTGRRVSLGPALRAVGLSEVPFQQAPDGPCVVNVEVNGAAGMMIIDTGASLGGVDNRFTEQMKVSGYTSGIRMLDAAGIESDTKLS